MPQVPKLNTQTSTPRQQSVGRLRVSAPAEAFGGGRAAQGMQDLGRAATSIGTQVEKYGDKLEKERQDKLDAEARLAAVRAKTLKKAQWDRVKLGYDTDGANDSMDLRSRRGVGGTAVVAEYDARTKERLENHLKNITDKDERARLTVELQESDLKRRNTLFTHQNQQTKLVAENDYTATGTAISTSMGANYSSLPMFNDNVQQWMTQFGEDTLRHAFSGKQEALGLTNKQINDDVKALQQKGSVNAINNLISDIPSSPFNSPEIETMRVKNIIDQFTHLDSKQRDKLKAEADTKLKDFEDKKKQDDKLAVQAENTQYTENINKIWATGSEIDARTFKNDYIRRNPERASAANAIFNGLRKQTDPDVDYKLDKMLNDSESLEKYKEQITTMRDKGEISVASWERQMKAADTDMPVRKKAIWDEGMARMDRIIAGKEFSGAQAGKNKIFRTGTFTGNIDAKKLKAEWANYREIALNSHNITDKELQDVQDKLFFKPEAKMQMLSLEDRLYEGSKRLARASLRPGTQDLERAQVDPFTKDRQRSTDELIKELNEISVPAPKKRESVLGGPLTDADETNL